MIDEPARRGDDFTAEYSNPVVLADGQRYFLPKPWIILRPAISGGGAVRAWPFPTAGDELDALIEAATEAEDPYRRIEGIALLAAHLLGRNYHLSWDEMGSLLACRLGDGATEAMVETILATATGFGAPRTLARWRRLTLLAANPGDAMLLEDANQLVDFLEYSDRTIPRARWAEEAIRAAESRALERLF